MAYSAAIAAEAMREYERIVSYFSGTLKSPSAAKGFADELMRQADSARDDPELHALSRMPELAARGYRPLFVKNYAVLVEQHVCLRPPDKASSCSSSSSMPSVLGTAASK